MFENVLREAKRDISDNDLAVVIIEHHDLRHGVVAPLQEAGRVDANSVDVACTRNTAE